MKFRTVIIFLAAIVLGLLLTAGVGAAWIVANSPVTKLQSAIAGITPQDRTTRSDGATQSNRATNFSRPATAIFISRQSPFVASLRVNPDRLLAAKLLTAPAQRQEIQDSFTQLQRAFLPDAQLNYSRDIRPWLGDEITLAITTSDFDRDSSNGAQLGYLVVMTTPDPALAQRKLQAFWQRHSRAKNRISEPYAGVEIIYRNSAKRVKQKGGAAETSPSDAPTLATAVVGDRFVLLANSPKVLRDALNNVQVAELNLENNSSYQQALDNLPQRAIGLAWVNLPQIRFRAGDLPREGNLSRTESQSESQSESKSRSTAASLLATWSLEAQELEAQGLIADLQLFSAEQQPFSLNRVTHSAPIGALRFVPADSAFVASGSHLQSQLETVWVSNGLNSSSLLSGSSRLISSNSSDTRSGMLAGVQRSLKAAAGQSGQISLLEGFLPEEALSWITGEYALAMLPHDHRAPDWVFITQRSPEALAGLEKLDAIAQSHNVTLGSFTLETPVGRQEIFAWTKFSTQSLKSSRSAAPTTALATTPLSLAAEVQGVRTTIGEYEVLATSLEAMNLAIQAPERSLFHKADFQRAIAALQKNNQGYLYANQPTLRHLIHAFAGQVDLAQNASLNHLLDRLQSLTFSSYGQKETDATGAVSLQMIDRHSVF